MTSKLVGAVGLKALGTAAGVLVSIYLLTMLGAADLGIFYMVVATARLLAIICSLGLQNAVLPQLEAARTRREKTGPLIGAITGLAVLLAGASGFIAWLAGIALLEGAASGTALLLSALTFITLIQLVLVELHRAHNGIFMAAALQSGQGRNAVMLFGLAGVGLFDMHNLVTLHTTLLAFTVSTGAIVIAALAAPNLWRRIQAPTVGALRLIISTALSSLPSTALNLGLPQVVLLICGLLAGPTAAGVLGFAQRVEGAVGFFQQALNISLVQPTRLYAGGRHPAANLSLVQFMAIATAGSVALALGFVVAGIPVLRLVADVDGLPNLELALAILVAAITLSTPLSLSATFLRNLGAYSLLTVLNGVATVAAIAICVAGAPAYGALAGAASLAAYRLILNGAATWRLRAIYGVPAFDPRTRALAWREMRRVFRRRRTD